MNKLLQGAVLAAALLAFASVSASAAVYVSETPSGAVGGRFYLSPQFSYTLTDAGRLTGNGYGGTVAVGKQLSPVISLELSALFSRLDGRNGAENTEISGYGFNTLLFPARDAGYLILGAGYGQVGGHPGPISSYNPLLLNLGAGRLWGPFGNSKFSLRTEALWRLDAHNDRRTGDARGNGRKAFNDLVFGVGVVVPIGRAPEATTGMEAPPVEEAAAQLVDVADADGDGVLDEADQCPDSAAGSTVDATGCPAAEASAAAEAAETAPSEDATAAAPETPAMEPPAEDASVTDVAPASAEPYMADAPAPQAGTGETY